MTKQDEFNFRVTGTLEHVTKVLDNQAARINFLQESLIELTRIVKVLTKQVRANTHQ